MAANAGHFKRRVPEYMRAEVARLLGRGCTQREIAAQTGLSRSTVGYLAKQPDVREQIRHERRREQDWVRKVESRERAKRAASAVATALEKRALEPAPSQVEPRRRRRSDRFADFLDEKDRDWEERAQNVARGRTAEGLVPARWPGAQSSYDPDDEYDLYRMVDLIASDCPELDPDKLVRADTRGQGAVVFNGTAARVPEPSTSG